MLQPVDLHTHTVAGGHGTTDTIADLAKSAAQKGMTLIGISDHGPATPGSCQESYFRALKNAPRTRAGITVLYGAEANILNDEGSLDLSDSVLDGLDYCIAGIHPQSYRSSFYRRASFWDHRQITEDPSAAASSNTQAYIRAMEHPGVRIISHPEDQHYPILCEPLIEAAASNGIILEVNEASLGPGGYRGSQAECIHTLVHLLLLAKKANLPVLLSSDSHGRAKIGSTPIANLLIRCTDYPRDRIVNNMPLPRILELLGCPHVLG